MNQLSKFLFLFFLVFSINCTMVNNFLDILATKVTRTPCQDPKNCKDANAANINKSQSTSTIQDIKITAQRLNSDLYVTAVRFAVSAKSSNGSKLGYQWQKYNHHLQPNPGFVDIAGATGTTYQTDSLYYVPNQDIKYKCKVYLIDTPTVIDYSDSYIIDLLHYEDGVRRNTIANVALGHTVNFMVFAQYNNTRNTISYQWQSTEPGSNNFIDIPGATNDRYTPPNFFINDNEKKYRCKISLSSLLGIFSYSTTYTVHVLSITTQPVNSIIIPGNSSTFNVSHHYNGWNYVIHQWESAPAGSTSFTPIHPYTSGNQSSYTTPPLSSADHNRQYRCRLYLSIDPSVYIYSNTVQSIFVGIVNQPVHVTSILNATPTFSVTVANVNRAISYQWQRADADSDIFTNIAAATNSSYTTPNITDALDNTRYKCLITLVTAEGTNDTLETDIVQLQILKIIEHPVATINNFSGSQITLLIDALLGNNTNDILYQWQVSIRNGQFNDIPEANMSEYTVNFTSNLANYRYRCKVYSRSVVLYSDITTVEYEGIDNNPQSTIIPTTNPSTVTFNISVSKNAAASITYQWYSLMPSVTSLNDAVIIAGATNSSYTTPNLSSADDGKGYYCKVTIAGTRFYNSDIARLKTGVVSQQHLFSVSDIINSVVDSNGNIYAISETEDYARMLKVSSNGVETRISHHNTWDHSQAYNIADSDIFPGASVLAIDNQDNVYYIDKFTGISKITSNGNKVVIKRLDFIYGNGSLPYGTYWDNHRYIDLTVNSLTGEIYFLLDSVIYKITPGIQFSIVVNNSPTTVHTLYIHPNRQSQGPVLVSDDNYSSISDIAVDKYNNLYYEYNNQIFKLYQERNAVISVESIYTFPYSIDHRNEYPVNLFIIPSTQNLYILSGDLYKLNLSNFTIETIPDIIGENSVIKSIFLDQNHNIYFVKLVYNINGADPNYLFKIN